MSENKRYVVRCYTTLVVEADSPEEAVDKYRQTEGLAIIAAPLLQEDHIDATSSTLS